MAHKVLKVRVTLKGRPIRAYTFSKEVITVGRDPASDIFLDNPGISREHCKIDFTSEGIYRIQDVGSSNGIFVNDKQVKAHFIINNDVVFVGKFALWFLYGEDRRGEREQRRAGPQDEGTTVLRTAELKEMIESVREAEAQPPAAPGSASAAATATAAMASATQTRAASHRARSLVVLGLLLAFFAGYVAGGGLAWVPWHDGLASITGALSRNQP